MEETIVFTNTLVLDNMEMGIVVLEVMELGVVVKLLWC